MRCDCMQRIVVEHGLRKQMMLELGVTYPTIRAALVYSSNTLTAKIIRKYALEHGGVLVKEISSPKHQLSQHKRLTIGFVPHPVFENTNQTQINNNIIKERNEK